MTIEQFKNVLHASPFRPFTFHMDDGRVFLVKHRISFRAHHRAGPLSFTAMMTPSVFSICCL